MSTHATPNTLAADLEALAELEGRLYAHRYALTDISFAGETHDPAKAAAGRGEAMAWLDQELHELLCSQQTAELLDRLSEAAAAGKLDEKSASQVRIIARDRAQEANVPAKVSSDFVRLTSEASAVWHRVKLTGDWDAFEPYMDKIVTSMKEIAGYKNANLDPYNVWLNEFEQGSSTDFYDSFFSTVKASVVPLVHAIVEKNQQPDIPAFKQRFSHAGQRALADDLVALEGIDPERLVLAETEHPFSDSVTSNHAFIAMHIYEDDVLSNVFSTLHEGGHALYELGGRADYDATSLHGGTSMGVHESQSRFFENYVGRSEAFAGPLLKAMQTRFPTELAGVTPHELYLAENIAQPSFVRTEADELTYVLHILVRYEIEKMLFAGEATAKDIPTLWADKYKNYLGITVPNHTVGALQDTHWSSGSLGYFPTYALGSAYGAQFKHAMIAGGMDFDAVCASGDLSPISTWLHDNIWTFARTKDPAQILLDATGEPFDASYFCHYLEEKFSALYQL